ncbi:hypothetical protein OGAPHI_004636 [Ogataea philodendri]|uniref:Carboxypeptidase n=1 Tax=Ogataea philodendri TaxID=1378263 RepID=A0A9P8P3C3_9ASCO|nr:uncharacterized protein OGAPHI_004636 [Ogataea philodendri]KAH3664284.1 hypothetical protein OGAPHI_004636 [Ogataea philodendri]
MKSQSLWALGAYLCSQVCGAAVSNQQQVLGLGIENDLLQHKFDSVLQDDVRQAWKFLEESMDLESLKKAYNNFENAVCPITSSFPVDTLVANKEAEVVTLDKLPNYQLRINKAKNDPLSLGVDTVKQSAGYFDINEDDKHLFYWFFESRNDPAKDPVILWLNGGPGCSSLTGCLFELGPSSINGTTLKPIYNPYSWNSNASVIFLEQPVGVGYSYSTKSSVSSTKVAAKDVFAFLELFFTKFSQYAKNDFHIAGESYAGHYIPNIAAEILDHQNKSFELTSILIGNGITDALIQYGWYGPMACNGTLSGYKQIIPDSDCELIDEKYPRCARLIEACYRTESAITCLPANIYCETIMEPFSKTGLNYYDIRGPCETDGDLCYFGMDYIDKYMNLPEVKQALGSEVDSYTGCDDSVFRQFIFSGDEPKPFQQYVAQVLEAGLPVLIYAGDKDYICNWLGNLAWTEALEWTNTTSFQNAEFKNWYTLEDGLAAGEVKSNGQFTFARVYDAGHMVPYDQPISALDMVNRWISGDIAYDL